MGSHFCRCSPEVDVIPCDPRPQPSCQLETPALKLFHFSVLCMHHQHDNSSNATRNASPLNRGGEIKLRCDTIFPHAGNGLTASARDGQQIWTQTDEGKQARHGNFPQPPQYSNISRRRDAKSSKLQPFMAVGGPDAPRLVQRVSDVSQLEYVSARSTCTLVFSASMLASLRSIVSPSILPDHQL